MERAKDIPRETGTNRESETLRNMCGHRVTHRQGQPQ